MERTHVLFKSQATACVPAAHTLQPPSAYLGLEKPTVHFIGWVMPAANPTLFRFNFVEAALSGSLWGRPESFLMIGKDASASIYEFAKRFQVACGGRRLPESLCG